MKLLQFTYYGQNFKTMTYITNITKPDYYMFAIYYGNGHVNGSSTWTGLEAIESWTEKGTIL